MSIDFSVLKNIDFAKSENLIFLAIIFILFIILIGLLYFVVFEFIRGVKRIFRKVFNMEAKRPKLDQEESTNQLSQIQGTREIDSIVAPNKEKMGVVSVEAMPKTSSRTQVPEGGDEHKEIAIPVSKHVHIDTIGSIIDGSSFNLGADASRQALDKKAEMNKGSEYSIFNTGSEVSRTTLKHEFRTDPKIWQAAKQAGLTISREEREKLVKEVLPQVYGRNISKTDLKWGIKKLNQKMLGTKDLAAHAKIRKEIKFFKKIGGIK